MTVERERTGEGRPQDDVVGPDLRASGAERRLGDFTVTTEVFRLLPLALVIGALAAVVALALVDLINLFTNLFYFQRLSVAPAAPASNTLGAAAVAIPVVGGLIVGLMARFGSERIRGHGIPEAMETILVGGSKVEPRVTLLKPLSSAISIGTGGPFGAEGPIILTGGGVGSVLAQFFHLSAIERRTLLVAGAAGGMSGIFGTPVAAVVLAVELLLFEWKPRSMVVVAAASATAMVVRTAFAQHGWLPAAPLFPVHDVSLQGIALLGALLVGVACGGGAWLLTNAVYGSEDGFSLLRFHWSWWPMIGGLVIGLGGLIQPRALGIGYGTIADELAGRLTLATLASLFVVKLVIWAVALGSGTSGGVLAPIMMMGAAIGGLMAPILPGGSSGTWAVVGLAALVGGTMRSPLTAVIFALELTHDVNLLLPILIAATAAHLLSALVLPRSILTEKVARRGFHVVREYAVEPLEALFVREVMRTDVLTVSAERDAADVYARVEDHAGFDRQRIIPILADDTTLIGVVSWTELVERAARDELSAPIGSFMRSARVTAFADESLRPVADRMAAGGGALPVVERDRPDHLVGIVTESDLLRARERRLVEERHRERVLRLRQAG